MTLTAPPTIASDKAVEPVTEAPANGSLKPVIDIIPAAAYDNPTWKGMAYFGRDLVIYGLVVWGLIVVTNPFAVLGLEILAALAVTSLFVVAHDSAHGALFRSKRLNSIVGHIAMLPSWHVFEGWILGHNRVHHAYTVRQGYDFVWHPYTAEDYAAMGPLGRLRHRFEWSWAGAGAYYIREVWMSKMMTGEPPARWRKAIRRDRIVVYAFIVTFGAILGAIGWSRTGTVWGTIWPILAVSGDPVPDLLLHDRLAGPRAPRGPGHQVVEAPGVDQVQGPDGGHDDHAGAPGRELLLPLDHGPHPAPRGHAHPDVQPRAGRRRHPATPTPTPSATCRCASGTSSTTPASASSTTTTPAPG